MNKYEFDPRMTFESAVNLTNTGLEAFKSHFNNMAISHFKKSNRLLIKIIAGLTNSNINLNLPGTYIENKIMIDELLTNTYALLGENSFFIIQALIEMKNFTEAKQFIKLVDKYFGLASKKFKTEEFYTRYLNSIIDILVILQETKDDKGEFLYLQKYLNLIAEFFQLGFKPDSVQMDNAIICFDRFRQLIENDEDETEKSIDFLYNLFFESGASSKDLESIDVYNFSIHNLENMILKFPLLVDDNEPKLFEILRETVTELLSGNMLEDIEDASYLDTLLTVLNKFSIYFRKPENLEELFQLNIDIVDYEAQLGRTDYVIKALKNANDILSINYGISSNFRKLKIHNRLLGLYGKNRDFRNAQEHQEMVETLLRFVQIEETFNEDYINTLEQAENELNLIKAESYYFLASIEIEKNKIFSGLNLLNNTSKYLELVDLNYKSDLKTNLTKLVLSLNEYIHNKLENEILY